MKASKRPFSLHKKFTLIVVPLILLAAFASSVILLELNRSYMLKEFNDNGKVIIDTHRPAIENLLWRFDYEALESLLAIIISNPDVTNVAVYDPDGNILSKLGKNNALPIDTLKADLNYDTKSKTIPLGTLEFSYSDLRLNIVYHERLTGYTLLIILFTITVILVSLMANRILVSRPIGRLQARMADSNVTGELVKTGINTNDEIGLLAGEYNTLVDIINEKQQELRHMATHDLLTGLPTRMLCNENLSFAISNSVRHQDKVAVLFVDLDGFKIVNDTLGHEAGDELLQEVANILLGEVRGNDIVARFGGDEFVVVLSDLKDKNGTIKVAEGIISSLNREFRVTPGVAHIGASIGVALYPDHAKGVDSLISAADMAMYKAKGSGKNAYAFADS
ncbi:MAG: diguanylate cyclase [Candidatus Brocadiaceae bacterium]|nr:diguanylate cyclase [Candidatus Brocadiaceae bacterium]